MYHHPMLVTTESRIKLGKENQKRLSHESFEDSLYCFMKNLRYGAGVETALSTKPTKDTFFAGIAVVFPNGFTINGSAGLTHRDNPPADDVRRICQPVGRQTAQ